MAIITCGSRGKAKDSQNKSLIRQAHLPLSCASGIAVQAETISHFDPIALSLGWLPLAFLAPLLPFPCHFFYRAPQGYSGSRPHRNDPAQAPSPRGIVVITVVLDHLLAFVGDMGAPVCVRHAQAGMAASHSNASEVFWLLEI